jgi:DNA gyrase subunit A
VTQESDKDLPEKPVNIEEEMKRSYLDYAMSVIVSRAIPDVRDGLKPVHRRILYAMYESGYISSKPHKKSARIVGDVIGKYHPHGDAAVYDSLVRMAQDFSLRVPLVDGQGNFGSIDGDSPAAMRYTESRLAPASDNLLTDIERETIDYVPNYDGSENEPVVLPARFPNLIVNGGGGIAVGMATNIPPHNLGEVLDACISYTENHSITDDEIAEIIKGPDFPTGGTILGTSGIRSAIYTGRGSVTIRGKTEIEKTKDNKEAIIITEIPYMVNKSRMIERIAELVKEKRIEGISDIRDESDKSGIRVVVEIKRDAIASVILNQLYSYSPLQSSFGMNMLALHKGKPKVLNMREVIAAFVEFREEVITRRTIFLLNKARDRAHLLLGLTIAVSNIDEIVKIIKSAPNPATAKQNLMQTAWPSSDIEKLIKLVDRDNNQIQGDKCYFTERQAGAILDMKLQRLTAMEKDKIEKELHSLASEIEEYIEILGSREKLLEILKSELREVKDKFSTPRLTEIEHREYEHDIEDLIQREDMVVTVTHGGYIKRVPLSTYKAQNRGGKGRSGASIKDEDIITNVFVGSTHTPLLFFSSRGIVYKLPLYKLPLGNPQSRGRPLVNLLPLKQEEYISNVMPLPENEEEWKDLNIIFASARGNVRRNSLEDFRRIQSNGKVAIRLEEEDQLIGVKVCDNDQHIFLSTYFGKSIRFPVGKVRIFKSRVSDGVKAIKLSEGDVVKSMAILNGTYISTEAKESYLRFPISKRQDLAACQEYDAEAEEIASSLAKEQNSDNAKILEPEEIYQMAKNEQYLLTITENGYGKRSSSYEYRITNRGGSGITNMAISKKTGNVVSTTPATEEEDVMLITNKGKLIRCQVESVRITGRNTSGVILFKTTKGEKVVSATSINSENEEDEEDAEEPKDTEEEAGPQNEESSPGADNE